MLEQKPAALIMDDSHLDHYLWFACMTTVFGRYSRRPIAVKIIWKTNTPLLRLGKKYIYHDLWLFACSSGAHAPDDVKSGCFVDLLIGRLLEIAIVLV